MGIYMNNSNSNNSNSNTKRKKLAILVLNDLLLEDFKSIVTYLDFKDSLLLISDLAVSKANLKKYGIPENNYFFDKLEDKDILIKRLRKFQDGSGTDFIGIIGLDEEYQYSLSKAIADSFGLASNSKDTLNLVSNKYDQICALKVGGVDVPEFKLFDSPAEVEGFRLPSVIKPVRGISSLYVYKNTTPKELRENAVKIQEFKENKEFLTLIEPSAAPSLERSLKKSSKKAVPKAAAKDFIIEEFIDGAEYSCDFLVRDGRIVDDDAVLLLRVVKKVVSKECFPFFEGLYLFNPDNDPDSEFSSGELRQVCFKIARSLKITNGLCMVDFRFDNKRKKIVVIETTTRPGVDDFIILMSRIYGYISLNVALRHIFGSLDDKSVKNLKAIPSGTSAIFYLFAPRPGILSRFDTNRLSLSKSSRSENLSGLKEVVRYNEPGDKITYLGSLKNPPYIGHVIIDGIKLRDIDRISRMIKDSVEIRMK